MLNKISIILSGLFLMFLFAHAKEDDKKSGKELFDYYCSSCHTENRVVTGPPFQRIREDYGVDWSLRFIKNAGTMIAKGDTVARYGFYVWGHIAKPVFPNLTDSQIIKILDYVDSFPVDSQIYVYREVSMKNKAVFIHRVDSARREFQTYDDWRQLLDK